MAETMMVTGGADEDGTIGCKCAGSRCPLGLGARRCRMRRGMGGGGLDEGA